MFAVTHDSDSLAHEILLHSHKEFVRTFALDKTVSSFLFAEHGFYRRCGGLLKILRDRFYPHYVEPTEILNSTQKRASRRAAGGKGSTQLIGKRIDRQLMHNVSTGKAPPRQSKLTTALTRYWRQQGHILQAAQLPVLIPGCNVATQADLITRDPATGLLWLWEVKTGMPLELTGTQHNFKPPLHRISCTKLYMWHLQLHFTLLALCAAGIPIAEARVIQVYETRVQGPQVQVHEQPEWVKDLGFQDLK